MTDVRCQPEGLVASGQPLIAMSGGLSRGIMSHSEDETLFSMLRPRETYVSYRLVNQLLEQTIRTQYDRLPVGERRLADVVLEMRCELAGYSATELAESAGVSKATASRLVRRLGFSGYQEMRQQGRTRPASGSPLAALGGAHARRGTLGRHLDHDVACLTQ